MKAIALDTSTEYLSLGIAEDKKILFEQAFLLERSHSTLLLPILGESLSRLDLSIQDIDGFIIGLGPGSFTGLRIGISMVKAMAVTLSKPVVGVPTLDCLAQSVSEKETQIVPFVDAKRNQVYAALYQRKNGSLQKRFREEVVPPEDFLKKVKGRTLFLGGGASLYREKIVEVLGLHALFADPSQDIPNPRTLLRLGMEKFSKKMFEDPRTLVPLYIYPKDCMIKRVER